MMTLPVPVEAKYQGFGMEEFSEGHPESMWGEHFKKARVLCYD